MKLEELLKQYRAENKISQRELARRCDLSNSLISLFEMGKNPQTGKQMSPDMETYKKLADGMGVSVHSLFEKLGNDATVNILPVQKIRKPFGKVIAGKVEEKVEKVEKTVETVFEVVDDQPAPPIEEIKPEEEFD